MLQKVFQDIKGFICLLICFRLQRPCYKISRWRRRKGRKEGLGRRQVFIPISVRNFMNPVPNKGFEKISYDPVHKYSLVYLYHHKIEGFLFVCRELMLSVFCNDYSSKKVLLSYFPKHLLGATIKFGSSLLSLFKLFPPKANKHLLSVAFFLMDGHRAIAKHPLNLFFKDRTPPFG